MTGEVRHLPLASFNPYTEARLGWVIEQGELEHTVRFMLDGSALEAHNDIVVEQLRVTPARGSDEVRREIGLPLGLIVALAKDRRGEIRASIPVSGSIADPAFNFRGLMWTAVRQSVARIVQAPFRAISRSLSRSSSGGEALNEPTVDPVTFAPGSAVIGSPMEQHLLRVADVLRRSPFVNLVLTPEPGADDIEALKAQAVTTRLRSFQAERGLPDGPGVAAAYVAERFPQTPRPLTVDDSLALLQASEPEPSSALVDLDAAASTRPASGWSRSRHSSRPARDRRDAAGGRLGLGGHRGASRDRGHRRQRLSRPSGRRDGRSDDAAGQEVASGVGDRRRPPIRRSVARGRDRVRA